MGGRHVISLCGVLFLFASHGLCDLNIGSHPSSLRFGLASSLDGSGFVDVLAASLGYTTKNSLWSGLTVTSAFHYPKAVIIFDVPTGGVNIPLEGTTYGLKEDVPLEEAFANLHGLIGSRAQRPVLFKSLLVDGFSGTSGSISIPVVHHLDKSESLDAHFLDQMFLLPTLAHELEEFSVVSENGQDVVMVRVDSLEPLVKAYGKTSPKVVEAVSIFRIALSQASDQVEKLYNGKVLVSTVLATNDSVVSRKTRSLLQDNSKQAIDHINLAAEYSEDYPVVFNIILFLTIIFFVSILAVSMSMATMDPGRDSIIYRMTNPRMKKD